MPALAGEAIVSSVCEGGERWLPARLLSALAHGGTNSISYSNALTTLAGYSMIVACGMVVLFRHRRA